MKVQVIYLNKEAKDGIRSISEFDVEPNDKLIIKIPDAEFSHEHIHKLNKTIRDWFNLNKKDVAFVTLLDLSLKLVKETYDLSKRKNDKYDRLINIVEQLEACNYITEDSMHTLNDNVAFIKLKELAIKEVNEMNLDKENFDIEIELNKENKDVGEDNI